jgi:hypothetical protein
VNLPVRGEKGLLHGVLCVLAAAEHVPTERQHLSLITVVEDLERLVVSVANGGDEVDVIKLSEGAWLGCEDRRLDSGHCQSRLRLLERPLRRACS